MGEQSTLSPAGDVGGLGWVAEMSFWTGKNESLLQGLVQATFTAILSGLVIALVARVLVVMVDNQIQVASERDALNTFRNDRLTTLTTRFSEAFLAIDCTRSARTVDTNECKSALSTFVTDLDVIFLELKAHYPENGFDDFLALKAKGADLFGVASDVTQAELDLFSATFGSAFDEMAQNFR